MFPIWFPSVHDTVEPRSAVPATGVLRRNRIAPKSIQGVFIHIALELYKLQSIKREGMRRGRIMS